VTRKDSRQSAEGKSFTTTMKVAAMELNMSFTREPAAEENENRVV